MANNVQKYKNWRAITESDYVTMFIKTWFAFVATLRELYPKERLEEIIGKGDKVFLKPYLDDFQGKYYHYNKFLGIKDNILTVYKLGRKFTLENKKYNRFFAEDFYAINNSFSWERTTEDFECSIRYSSDTKITIHAKYLDQDFVIDGKPLIIYDTIDIADILTTESLSDAQRTAYLEDESAYINDVVSGLIYQVSHAFFSRITAGNYEAIFEPKVLAHLNSVSLSINSAFETELSLMKDPAIQKEDVLYYQSPCVNFIYQVEDGKTVPEEDTYKWFLNFVYFMRNALFHEIIDPLDEFWQELFKHSYLALKEVLDGNINFFLEKRNVHSLLLERAQGEIRAKPEIYIPDYNDSYNNGELELSVSEYTVDDNNITLKADAGMDYWHDEHTQKRMIAKLSAVINRKTKETDSFKMRFIQLDDIA